jgi:hypothetical protein
MSRAIGAIAWVVAGALLGVITGIVVGLIAGATVVAALQPGRMQDMIGALVWAIACGTCTVVGALAGATGGIVWGLRFQPPRRLTWDGTAALREPALKE